MLNSIKNDLIALFNTPDGRAVVICMIAVSILSGITGFSLGRM